MADDEGRDAQHVDDRRDDLRDDLAAHLEQSVS